MSGEALERERRSRWVYDEETGLLAYRLDILVKLEANCEKRTHVEGLWKGHGRRRIRAHGVNDKCE